MRSYSLAFGLVEVVHLFGLTVMLGTIYTVNFRLFGFALKSRSVSEIAEGLARWTLIGYVVTFATGILLFVTEAMKMAENTLWPYKMACLFGGLIVQLTMYRYITKPGRAEANPILAKITAGLSTVLWLVTGMAARAIAFI
jgi:hypothetical protein